MCQLSVTSPAHYRIIIHGSLDQTWSERLGMQVRVGHDADQYPVTTLTGEVLDQSMLLGILNYVCGMGMPIVQVQWLSAVNVT